MASNERATLEGEQTDPNHRNQRQALARALRQERIDTYVLQETDEVMPKTTATPIQCSANGIHYYFSSAYTTHSLLPTTDHPITKRRPSRSCLSLL